MKKRKAAQKSVCSNEVKNWSYSALIFVHHIEYTEVTYFYPNIFDELLEKNPIKYMYSVDSNVATVGIHNMIDKNYRYCLIHTENKIFNCITWILSKDG